MKLDADLLAAIEDRAKAKAELQSAKSLMDEALAALASAKVELSAASKAKEEAEAAKSAAIAAAKVSTISCINSKKSIWTVTSISPKCPTGYKKK